MTPQTAHEGEVWKASQVKEPNKFVGIGAVFVSVFLITASVAGLQFALITIGLFAFLGAALWLNSDEDARPAPVKSVRALVEEAMEKDDSPTMATVLARVDSVTEVGDAMSEIAFTFDAKGGQFNGKTVVNTAARSPEIGDRVVVRHPVGEPDSANVVEPLTVSKPKTSTLSEGTGTLGRAPTQGPRIKVFTKEDADA